VVGGDYSGVVVDIGGDARGYWWLVLVFGEE